MNRTYKTILYILTAACMLASAGCSDFIKDDEGDCAPRNFLKLTYTMNTAFGDAFQREVKMASVYFYQDDQLVQMQEVSAASMTEGNLIPLCDKGLKPGEKYHVVVWAGSETTDKDFDVKLTRTGEKLQEMTCKMRRTSDNIVNYQCQPLFYGAADITLSEEEGRHYSIVDLTKDTNNISIVLQSTEEDTDLTKYTCSITYDNGLLDYQNNKLEDKTITFKPHTLKIAEAGMTIYEEGEEKYQKMNALVASFRLSRLFAGTNPMFHLYTTDDEGQTKESVRLPLIDYILLMRDKYEIQSDQELLDRENNYNMTFFLKGTYLAAQIYINDWRYVVHKDIIMK